MRLRLLDRLAAADAAQWDALFPAGYPFTRHAFLGALETSGCATPASGWQPAHAVLEGDDGRMLAAAPLYLKSHSYGEFVFDFAWAEASHRLRQPYYPKWLCAVPFTPVTGPRLGAADGAARTALAEALLQVAADSGRSSLHALFLEQDAAAALAAAGAALRHDVQFHWYNRGYLDFADFLERLTSAKRKKILRERRRIAEAGLRHRWQRGDELAERDWAEVYALYGNTYEERGQAPYLTLDFFLGYARAPGSPVRLVSAFDGDRRVAVAITWLGEDTLYGRHWGAAEHYHSLHFETCYYQGIDYCIRHRLSRFDAGAQGTHKLARGFEPTLTTSAHWLAEARLHAAVADALAREARLVRTHHRLLSEHAPYKRESTPAEDGNG